MKKEITFFELLQMMKEGTAPKSVEYGACEWIRRDDDYYVGDRIFLSDEIGKKLMKEILNVKCVSYDEAVLTDKEREYLSAVLKPYKDRVKDIVLYGSVLDNYVYLTVRITSEAKDCVDSMQFPYFEKGTMYAGMSIEKKYTPSELGLWEEDA